MNHTPDPYDGAFARTGIALLLNPEGRHTASKWAADQRHWGGTPEVSRYLKAPVPAGSTDPANWAGATANPPGSTTFLRLLARVTAIGRFGQGGVPALHGVPFAVPVPAQVGAGTAYWTGEDSPRPMTAGAFASLTLPPLGVNSVAVLSKELVERGGARAEGAVMGGLVAALAPALDSAFLDPASGAVAGVRPASITSGVVGVASAGTVAADVETLVQATTLSLDDAVLVMAPDVAVTIRCRLGGAAAGLGARGGELFGLPVVTSTGIGANLALVHASHIAVADEGGVQLDAVQHASVILDDDPENVVQATGAVPVHTSLWQHGLVGLRATRAINWTVASGAAVQLITAVDYAVGAP